MDHPETIDRLFFHCKELITLSDGPATGARRAEQMQALGLIEDGAVAVQAGKILAVGKTSDLRAQYQAREELDLSDFVVLPGDLNLSSESERRECLAWLQTLSPALVILDTFSAASGGIDENAAGDVGKILGWSREVSRRTSALVIIVHHTPKSDSGTARGSSVLEANVDGVVKVQSGLVKPKKIRSGRPGRGKVALVLHCVSRIQPSGKMKDTGCFTQNQFEQSFNSQVVRAAKKARMIPALINGKAYEIYLQFRVEFAAEKDEMLVRLYPNTGYEENVLEYGANHSGGQRAIGRKEPWNDACPSHAKYTVWVRAYLGEDGRAASPSIEFGNGLRPISTCLDAIKQTIINSKYAPAMSNGVFVPSTYVELFGN